jgi:uncharacterized protein involved in response to NO
MLSNLCKDPFRLCFPIAFALAIYASSLWISFVFFGYGPYPGQDHARIFVGGFLYLSILGFLMTAIPRFTKTDFASPKEILTLSTAILLVLATILVDQQSLFWMAVASGWILLIVFAVPRFLKRAENPPYTFVFVGLGVGFGLVGAILQALYYSDLVSSGSLLKLGQICFFDTMVLSFVIGVGGRLIPGILGFQEIVQAQRQVYEAPKPFLKIVPTSVFVLGLLFLGSVVLEAAEFSWAGFLLRALVVSYVSFVFWQIHRKPPEVKWHGVFILLSCWFVFVSSWALVLTDSHQIAWKHLSYVGGYSLLTFLVASRVTLAHSAEGLGLERKHLPFTVIGLSVSLAAVTRVYADFTSASYLGHLGYAALCFLFGLLVWGAVFIPKIIKGIVKQ